MRGYELRIKDIARAMENQRAQGVEGQDELAGLRRTSMQVLKDISTNMVVDFIKREVLNRYVLAGAFLSGTGVAIMHYTGMAALQVNLLLREELKYIGTNLKNN